MLLYPRLPELFLEDDLLRLTDLDEERLDERLTELDLELLCTVVRFTLLLVRWVGTL